MSHWPDARVGRFLSLVHRQSKPRLTLDEDRRRIRANYGHSINRALDLEPLEPPEHLYHGTAERRVDSILPHRAHVAPIPLSQRSSSP